MAHFRPFSICFPTFYDFSFLLESLRPSGKFERRDGVRQYMFSYLQWQKEHHFIIPDG
jgi:hypothetical protein